MVSEAFQGWTIRSLLSQLQEVIRTTRDHHGGVAPHQVRGNPLDKMTDRLGFCLPIVPRESTAQYFQLQNRHTLHPLHRHWDKELEVQRY